MVRTHQVVFFREWRACITSPLPLFPRVYRGKLHGVATPRHHTCLWQRHQIILQGNVSRNIRQALPAQPLSPFQTPEYEDLDSQLNPYYTFENYYTSDSNKVARITGEAVAASPGHNPFNPMFVYGESGVGKTHLIQAIGIKIKEQNPRARVLYLSANLFQQQYTTAVVHNQLNNFINFYQSIDVLLMDDIQEFAGKIQTQNTFFHIFNHLHLNGKQLVLTCDRPPVELEGIVPRLLTRFKWGLQVEVERPDYSLRRDILHNKIERDGLVISDEIVDYINNGGNGNRLDTAINEIPGTTPKPPAPCPDSLKGKWLQMWGVAPLIKTAWDQDIPYNIYCPTINNEYTLAGCAPIAASQIGAHLAPPGTSWDWELIIGTDSISKDAAAKFIAYTGEIMNADYGLANTGASIYDAKRFLKNSIGCKNLSIRTCKDFTKFYDRVTGRLKYHLPVYTRGKNSNGEGHAYIIDGYVEQKKYIGDYAMERRSLFHINWGWGGKHNGWYLADLLDCSKEIKEGAPQTATIPTGSGPNIYDGGMQTLTYMIPEWMQ